jgi:hypothetical protein
LEDFALTQEVRAYAEKEAARNSAAVPPVPG